MKKIKLISILLALTYILSLMPTVYAGDVLTITSPANGSIISFETSAFTVAPPEGKTIKTTNFIIDGEFIGNGNAEGELALNDKLTLGEHTLEVVAVYNDGTAEKAVSKFTSAIIPKRSVIDFEGVSSGEYSDSASALNSIKKLKLISNTIYNSDNAGKVAVEEETGYGKVLKIKTTTKRILAAAAYIQIYTNPSFASDGTPTNTIINSGKIGVSFDAYLPYSTKQAEITQFVMIPYSSAGTKLKVMNLVINNKILDTYTIESGWYSFDLEYDLDTLNLTGTVSDVGTSNVWTIPETKFADSATNISYIQIGTRFEKENYIAIDNINAGAVGNFIGITDILVKDEMNSAADADGYVNADLFPVNRDVTEMIIKFDKLLDSATVTKDNVFVTAGGERVEITKVEYDAVKNLAVLTLKNTGITAKGKCYVELSKNVKFRGASETVGIAARRSFDLVPYGFEIQGVDFSKTASDVYSASQLSVGDMLTANFRIQNMSDSTETLTAALVVKDGKRILSVTPRTVTVEAGDDDFTSSITSKAISSDENLSASLIFVNSLPNPVYIDSIDLN